MNTIRHLAYFFFLSQVIISSSSAHKETRKALCSQTLFWFGECLCKTFYSWRLKLESHFDKLEKVLLHSEHHTQQSRNQSRELPQFKPVQSGSTNVSSSVADRILHRSGSLHISLRSVHYLKFSFTGCSNESSSAVSHQAASQNRPTELGGFSAASGNGGTLQDSSPGHSISS